MRSKLLRLYSTTCIFRKSPKAFMKNSVSHKLQVIKKQSLKFWFHKSRNVDPRCIICTLVGEACILRFDMPYFISILKTLRLGKKGGYLKPKYATLKMTIPRPLSGGGLWKHNLRFKLLYINFQHHMGSANHQPACLVVVTSLLTVTYRYLVSPA